MGESTGVLLIEDDTDVGLLLFDILTSHLDVSVSLVRHPTEIPADVRPTVIVTDLFGFAYYDRPTAIRQLEQLRRRFPGVPIVLVTAHAHAARERDLLPADAVMEKPFDVDALAQLVLSFDLSRRSPAPDRLAEA